MTLRRIATGPFMLLALTIGGWTVMRAALVSINTAPQSDVDDMPGLLFPIGLDIPGPTAMAGPRAESGRAQGRAPVAAAPIAAAAAAVPAARLAVAGDGQHRWVAQPDGPPGNAAEASSAFTAMQIALLRHLVQPARSARWSMQRVGRSAEPLGPPTATTAPTLMADGPGAVPRRWAASAWMLYRAGAAPAASLAGQGRLGGSQAGVRLSYQIGSERGLRAVARLTATPGRRASAEAALGAELRPWSTLPLAVVVERRQALVGPDARSAVAAYVTGGLSDAALPADFALDAYGAAGVVGLRRRDVFAEGALRAVRPIATVGRARLAIGGGTWAAAQPGASRVDVGPVIETRFGAVHGMSPRLALDYRARVAGDSAPGSGLALTLSTDF